MKHTKKAAATVLILALAFATTARGAPVTMINNGSSSNRVDTVFLGDGYTQTDLNNGVYTSGISSYLGHMFGNTALSEPFVRYQSYFNVHRIDVVSAQSGADIPALGVTRDTALDATFSFFGGPDRLLYINEAKANAALASGLAGAGFSAEMRVVTVNSDRYGGGGGNYAVYAGGNASSNEVALHELGHSFGGLADEYGGNPGPHAGVEPSEVNVSMDAAGAKWAQWLGYDQPGIGVIGAYEGAKYYDQGLYRPSLDSKMRSLDRPFDAVSREELILDIYNLVDPLDAWLDNTLLLANPGSIWVDLIDPSLINVQWFVDGVMLPGAGGEELLIGGLNLASGDHTIRARAFDPMGFDPIDGWVRRNQSALEQDITWRVSISPDGHVPEPGMLSLALLGLTLVGRRQHSRASMMAPSQSAAVWVAVPRTNVQLDASSTATKVWARAISPVAASTISTVWPA